MTTKIGCFNLDSFVSLNHAAATPYADVESALKNVAAELDHDIICLINSTKLNFLTLLKDKNYTLFADGKISILYNPERLKILNGKFLNLAFPLEATGYKLLLLEKSVQKVVSVAFSVFAVNPKDHQSSFDFFKEHVVPHMENDLDMESITLEFKEEEEKINKDRRFPRLEFSQSTTANAKKDINVFSEEINRAQEFLKQKSVKKKKFFCGTKALTDGQKTKNNILTELEKNINSFVFVRFKCEGSFYELKREYAAMLIPTTFQFNPSVYTPNPNGSESCTPAQWTKNLSGINSILAQAFNLNTFNLNGVEIAHI